MGRLVIGVVGCLGYGATLIASAIALGIEPTWSVIILIIWMGFVGNVIDKQLEKML